MCLDMLHPDEGKLGMVARLHTRSYWLNDLAEWREINLSTHAANSLFNASITFGNSAPKI